MPDPNRILVVDAVSVFGSQAELARILGVTRSAVNLWAKTDGGAVPKGRAYELIVRFPGKFGGRLVKQRKSLTVERTRQSLGGPNATASDPLTTDGCSEAEDLS